jgi:DNA repair protein RadC
MQDLNNISEITISYRPSRRLLEMPILNSSTSTYKLVRSLFPEDQVTLQEQFIILYLNRSNRIIGCYRHTVGGITGTVADIRLILAVALKCTATGIVLAHNHPSGNVKPSAADLELTRKIREAATLMDIRLLDHIIISPWGEYLSFADEGLA